ncbi:hypothetical protein [Magnetofaba australis]|uniref:Uncharacterized protein n=1 Tax=Magnetofaba australis IT-1 TaxID=1434232 RepID=A0A1Y2JZN1_9PROT|nr:hypothetical protein [Magnetofaba australis]OSM00014.1 hypothetical protein MAIT1_00417 [Magnetofaba australis IT-1]
MQKLPKLVRFLITHAVTGFVLAFVAVQCLILWDVDQLGKLLSGAENGGLAQVILTFFLGLTFASVQMGAAVMLLAERPVPPNRGRFIERMRRWMAPPSSLGLKGAVNPKP